MSTAMGRIDTLERSGQRAGSSNSRMITDSEEAMG